MQTHIGTPSDQKLSKETIFDLLRNSRRRYALRYLDNQTETVHLRELAEALANWEQEDRGVNTYISHKERKRAYIALYQTHLPKLDDAGVIEYNQPRGTIELNSISPELRDYLYQTHTAPVQWHRLYLGTSGFSLGLLSLHYITPGMFGFLPDVVWFILVTILLGSVLVADLITDRLTDHIES